MFILRNSHTVRYAFTILLLVGLLTGSLWLLGTWKHQVLPTPRPSNPIELITIPNVVLSALLPVAIITIIHSIATFVGVLRDVYTLCVNKQLPNEPIPPRHSTLLVTFFDIFLEILVSVITCCLLYLPLYVSHYGFPKTFDGIILLVVISVLWAVFAPLWCVFLIPLFSCILELSREQYKYVRWFCYHDKLGIHLTT